MKIVTKVAGTIEIEEDSIIHFPDGVFGFPEYERWVIVPAGDEENPFFWLQSIDDTDAAFIVINLKEILPSYNLSYSDIDKDTRSFLNYDESASLFGVVIIPENPREMTVNLQGPLVVDSNNYAAQVVNLRENYDVRTLLFDLLENNPDKN